jgi:hypothetical protein
MVRCWRPAAQCARAARHEEGRLLGVEFESALPPTVTTRVISPRSLLGCSGAWAAGEVRPISGGRTMSTRSPIAERHRTIPARATTQGPGRPTVRNPRSKGG